MNRPVLHLRLIVTFALAGVLALMVSGCGQSLGGRTLEGRVVYWNVPDGAHDGELRLRQSVDAGIPIERVVSLPLSSATSIVTFDGTVYGPQEFYDAFGGETENDSVATDLAVVVTVVGSGRDSRVRKIAPLSRDPEIVSVPWPQSLGASPVSLQGVLTPTNGPTVRVESPVVDDAGLWTYFALDAAVDDDSRFIRAGAPSMRLNDALQAPAGWVDIAGLMKVSAVTSDGVATAVDVERVGHVPSDWHGPWE